MPELQKSGTAEQGLLDTRGEARQPREQTVRAGTGGAEVALQGLRAAFPAKVSGSSVVAEGERAVPPLRVSSALGRD